MQVFTEIGLTKTYLKQHRSTSLSVGLVPTMGALHNGHVSLIRASKKENDITVCSIYVNPAQFNNPSDLSKYPRTLDKDIMMLKEAGCDAVFCPTDSQMYGETPSLKLDFGQLEKVLEGEFRPGHFSGVGIVVAKLFHIIQPDRAYFGQKDFQQFKIISKLVEDLKFDIELRCVPIIREQDGLAMSSRNMRLDETERKQATIFYQILRQTKERLLKGDSFASLKEEMADVAKRDGARLEYLALANKTNFILLEDVTEPSGTVLLIAGYVGEVRLIDNILMEE